MSGIDNCDVSSLDNWPASQPQARESVDVFLTAARASEADTICDTASSWTGRAVLSEHGITMGLTASLPSSSFPYGVVRVSCYPPLTAINRFAEELITWAAYPQTRPEPNPLDYLQS
jgi:hypothetical protein